MKIGEIAGRAGVTAKTIRFWEDQDLLPPPARTPTDYRDYDPAILERLAFIRHAQAAGLTLDAIRQVLDIRDGGEPPCAHVTGLIARRLAEVDARLAELARARAGSRRSPSAPRRKTRPTARATARSSRPRPATRPPLTFQPAGRPTVTGRSSSKGADHGADPADGAGLPERRRLR